MSASGRDNEHVSVSAAVEPVEIITSQRLDGETRRVACATSHNTSIGGRVELPMMAEGVGDQGYRRTMAA